MLRSIKGRLSISRSLVGRRLEKYGLEPLKPCLDRKSTRLNSSHRTISYAVFCLKKKIHSKLREQEHWDGTVVFEQDLCLAFPRRVILVPIVAGKLEICRPYTSDLYAGKMKVLRE